MNEWRAVITQEPGNVEARLALAIRLGVAPSLPSWVPSGMLCSDRRKESSQSRR